MSNFRCSACNKLKIANKLKNFVQWEEGSDEKVAICSSCETEMKRDGYKYVQTLAIANYHYNQKLGGE